VCGSRIQLRGCCDDDVGEQNTCVALGYNTYAAPPWRCTVADVTEALPGVGSSKMHGTVLFVALRHTPSI